MIEWGDIQSNEKAASHDRDVLVYFISLLGNELLYWMASYGLDG